MKKILIVQRHHANIGGIETLIKKELPAMHIFVTFCSNLTQALSYVTNNDYAVVITGRVFDGNAWGGFAIAETAKRKNVATKVLLYSVMPEQHKCVDGCIPKQDGTCQSGEHGALIDYLKNITI